MCIETEADLLALREAGRVTRLALEAMRAALRPGVTTAELNAVAARILAEHGARSAPMLVYDFPAETCISVNDEIVHGIPSGRTLEAGDLVKLDVTVEKDGYMADAAITVPVGAVSARALSLVACAEQALRQGLRAARAGRRACDVGAAIEDAVARRGFAVVRALHGHGIGRTIHEEPAIPNFFDPSARAVLADGLVVTVEPIIAMGRGDSYEADDGWTMRTADGSLSAHVEHTVVIRHGAPLLLTAA